MSADAKIYPCTGLNSTRGAIALSRNYVLYTYLNENCCNLNRTPKKRFWLVRQELGKVRVRKMVGMCSIRAVSGSRIKVVNLTPSEKNTCVRHWVGWFGVVRFVCFRWLGVITENGKKKNNNNLPTCSGEWCARRPGCGRSLIWRLRASTRSTRWCLRPTFFSIPIRCRLR